MRRRPDWFARGAGVPTGRWYPARTSGQVGGTEDPGPEAGRIEIDIFQTGLVQQITNGRFIARQPAIIVVSKQYVGWPAPVGDHDGSSLGGSFGATDILVEFSAG